MKKLSFLFIIVAVLGSSCKKDWLTSLQNNPNAPVVASGTPPLVLPGTMTGLVSVINGPYTGAPPHDPYSQPPLTVTSPRAPGWGIGTIPVVIPLIRPYRNMS